MKFLRFDAKTNTFGETDLKSDTGEFLCHCLTRRWGQSRDNSFSLFAMLSTFAIVVRQLASST